MLFLFGNCQSTALLVQADHPQQHDAGKSSWRRPRSRERIAWPVRALQRSFSHPPRNDRESSSTTHAGQDVGLAFGRPTPDTRHAQFDISARLHRGVGLLASSLQAVSQQHRPLSAEEPDEHTIGRVHRIADSPSATARAGSGDEPESAGHPCAHAARATTPMPTSTLEQRCERQAERIGSRSLSVNASKSRCRSPPLRLKAL